LITARALYVVFPPNDDVPHSASFLYADFSGPAGFDKTLAAQRIRQEMNLRFGANRRESRIAQDPENQF
jgi:hypothetical protein